MTDKQIIINGVDISKCKHYDEVFNYCDQSYLGEGGLLKNTKNPKRCDCSPNCYYKQLKRKEQSEVKLVRQIQTICDFINNRPETFKGIYGGVDKIITEYAERKEQECEKLKIQLMQKSEVDTFFNTPIEGWDNDSCKICEYKQNYQAKEQECEGLKKIINEARNSM